MKQWKWILPTCFLSALALISLAYFSQDRKDLVTETPNKREQTPMTKEEISQDEKKRRPSSTQPVPTPSKHLKESLTPIKREIVGKKPDELSTVDLQNNYDPKWKKRLTAEIRRNLTHNMRENFKLNVQRKKSVFKMTSTDEAKLYEIVVVSLAKKNSDYQNSYEALVDSETGKIKRTWNSTIHEPTGREELKTSIRPTGSL